MQIKSSSAKIKSLSLDEVKCRFEHWRKTRSKKGRIPEELWDAAVNLAETCSINQIAKTLHLSYGSLRDRIHLSNLKTCTAKEAPTFVELNLQTNKMNQCVVKMESEDGIRMEVQFHECSPSNLAEFCSVLWRKRS